MGVGPVGFGVEQQALIWAMWRRGDAIREIAGKGETMTTAATATYAYDQIDQARTELEHPS